MAPHPYHVVRCAGCGHAINDHAVADPCGGCGGPMHERCKWSPNEVAHDPLYGDLTHPTGSPSSQPRAEFDIGINKDWS